jgi:hypothetical protein
LKLQLQEKIDDLRFRGFGGTAIQLHRAIKQIKLSRGNLILAALLPLAFNLLLLCFLGAILACWEWLFEFWLGKLAPGALLATHDIDLGMYTIALIYPQLNADEPSVANWLITMFATLIILLLSFRVTSKRMLPLAYIARACALIQATALAYFFALPGHFPHDAASALGDALSMSIYFLFLIPWLLGVTYYIFNFSLLRKMGLTAMMIIYFAVALPMQYLAHALIFHHFSLLFVPLLYLVFGIFIDVMMFVALYSLGMSWATPDRQRSPS